MILVIKVDVDTYRGCREGIPRLLALFKELGIHASFFLPYGPDKSGKAIRQLWRPGFLAKMIRTNALRMYGLRAALSGTLLPAPILSSHCRREFLQVRDAGHEAGVHGWDHRRWQDEVCQWTRDQIREELDRAFASHEKLFSEPPRSFAAPGWTVTDQALLDLDCRKLLYSSSTRYGQPFRPRVGSTALRFIEIPSTELCPEEALNAASEPLFPEFGRDNAECVVYPAHAEVEGGILFDAFRTWLLKTLESTGACCRTLEQVAKTILSDGAVLPEREIHLRTVTGRPLPVSSGRPEVGEHRKPEEPKTEV